MIEALSKAPIVINGVVGQDFTGRNFSGVILQGGFTDCVFASADFRGAIFEEGTNFLNCDFSGALAQGTAIAKYITTSISPGEVISRTAQIDSSTAISSFALTTITPSTTLNSVALATTNSIVSSLPKASSLFWPVAGTALGLAAFYGLYKANQHYLTKEPVGLHEYPKIETQLKKEEPRNNNELDLNIDQLQPDEQPLPRPQQRKTESRKRKQPTANSNGEPHENQGRPKRRKLDVDFPKNWRELVGADGMDRPKRHAAGIARKKIQKMYISRS